ncbi:MAG: hypothetical protein RIE58_07760 [Vicingaceae bacterium]
MSLKGFTIIDVLIGMILSSLVIGFGLTAYLHASKAINRRMSMMKEVNMLSELRYVLTTDMERATEIRKEDGLVKMIGNQHRVSYQNSNSFVLRLVNDHTDTLFQGNMNVEYFKDGESLVNLIEFRAGSWSFRYQKDYASVPLIAGYGH